jgi:hypothetical protein
MWSEVLYAIVAAVVLYALLSVVLKVSGTKLRASGHPDVEGEPRTGDVGPRHPE